MKLSKSEGRVLLYVEDDPAAPLLLEAAISESTVPGVARLVTVVTGQPAGRRLSAAYSRVPRHSST